MRRTRRATAKKRPAAKKRPVRSRKRVVAKKRAAKKRAVKKRASKKRASKPKAKRTARKNVARRAAKRPARTKKASSRAKKRGAGARPRAKRPALKVVRGAKKRAAPPPAFPQTGEASARQNTLFQMVRARASVIGAIQGLTAISADRPMGEGKWSVRLTLIHLVTRDRARLAEMDAALLGTRASWIGSNHQDWARMNAEEMAPLVSLSWEETVRMLHSTRQKLMEAVESVPEERAEVWAPEHTFAEMLAGLPPHDRHHADAIKRWRESLPPPT